MLLNATKEKRSRRFKRSPYLFQRAADLGQDMASYPYARMCYYSEGGSQNLFEAWKYFTLAAQQWPKEEARQRCAEMCEKKEGCPRGKPPVCLCGYWGT